MMITNEIIDSSLRCSYKSYLQFNNTIGKKTEYEDLEHELRKLYRGRYYKYLRKQHGKHILPALKNQKFSRGGKTGFLIAPTWQSNQFYTSFDAAELLVDFSTSDTLTYVPMSVSPKETIPKLDKLSFVMKCLVLVDHGISPRYGKIIYGCNLRSTKVSISVYSKEAKKELSQLIRTVNSPQPPRYYRNKYCTVCEFHDTCRKELLKADDISLLGSISTKEVHRMNSKGLFSIFQLSHTFRPRKKSKSQKNERYSWELKALALKEHRTYIRDIPRFPECNTEVYIDFEGLPEEGFVYLIGMMIKDGEDSRCLSYWADSKKEELFIFKQLCDTLSDFQDYTVYHYGHYEIRTLKRICLRLDEIYRVEANRIIDNSVNVLSFFTSVVYPPTYTNGLKDIARFLGFKWSRKDASGLQSIVWRKKWELYRENKYKHALKQYNTDDCRALNIVKCWLCRIEKVIEIGDDKYFARPDNVEVKKGRYGRINYVFPELEEVNKYAYFDYQRSKIYLKSNSNIKKALRRKERTSKSLNKIDRTITLRPERCIACNSDDPRRLTRTSRTVIDLRFMKHGIKKWVIKWNNGNFRCLSCGKVFVPKNLNKVSCWGDNLMLWAMNQYMQYRLSYNQIINILSDSFNIRISRTEVWGFKRKLAQKYQKTYDEIQRLVTSGTVIHADETKASARDLPSAYVWVFASMDSVFYLLRPNREAGFLHDLMNDFQGVLVSDFYSGYDSIQCAQQKCLVHLIRDLNGDLLKNPLNLEFESLVYHFGKMLRNIIETINRYGLKKRFLKKHQREVDEFYNHFVMIEYETDLTIRYQKRFKKYRSQLFTFLQYDNIPWNNNNAESAIKPFAKYRVAASGMTTQKGLKDYLVLLSIQQTCRYRGISFWDFLRSGYLSIEEYSKKH